MPAHPVDKNGRRTDADLKDDALEDAAELERDEERRTEAEDHPEGGEHRPGGFLGLVERVGNKLPDPFWLFVILSVVVLISSWIGNKLGMRAEIPSDGETVEVTNLLSAEGLQKMVSEAVENFITFPPLGVILIVMLGIAVAEHSGLLGAAMRGAVGRVRHPMVLTFVVALTAVTGSIASDAVYVIMIPLGAAAFSAVGRSPIVGAMVAFAASSGGFNASLLLNITDLLLSGISTSAAAFIDESYKVSPLANYFFVIPSAIVLALLITAVTELFINDKARDLVNHDHVDDDAASFTTPDHIETPDDEGLKLAAEEIRGLKVTGLFSLGMLGAYFGLLFIPGSPFLGADNAAMESVLITDIGAVIGVMFFAAGLVYGLVTRSITSGGDVPRFMAKGLETLVPMMVLFFAVSQFLAYFEWSNLGQWTAIKGSEALTVIDMPKPLLFALFVLLVAAINLLITSGSAQWALMAPVVVPMFMLVDIAPEVTQMLYRIGDSPANIVTPMSPYFALALMFLQKYYRKAGLGTLMSLSLPYAVTMMVGWFLFFLAWYYTGLPLGPGTPMEYPAG